MNLCGIDLPLIHPYTIFDTYTTLLYRHLKKILLSNVRTIKQFIGHDVAIAAAIKANAYRHGQNEISKMLR